MKSKWVNSHQVNYKVSGRRIATLVYNKKQIGTITTSNQKPLNFRLAVDCQVIADSLSGICNNISKIVKNVEDLSIVGYGQTMIDIEMLVKLNDNTRALLILNAIYDTVIQAYTISREQAYEFTQTL